MNDQQPAPLPAAIERLLRAERDAPAPSAAVAARVFRRVNQTVGGAAGAASVLAGAKWYLIAALITAGASGVLWNARRRSTPAAPPATVETIVLAPIEAAPVAAVAASAPSVAPVTPPVMPARPRRAHIEHTLGAESAMLTAARRSLSSGDPAGALVQLRAHARRWPRGTLEQEREILLIQSLVRQGESAAAGARARRFLRRFPDSTLADTAREHAASE
jgi:hypothetical protein